MAQTEIKSYAIRKEYWFKIMNEFPDILRIIKQKSFNFYFNQIYNPLIKRKQKDIEKFGERNDYMQVLSLNNYSIEDMQESMQSIFDE